MSVGAVSQVPETVADLLDQLGGIPAERVRLRPSPGTATEQDVIDVHAREKRLCELVDGVLVEKAMGYYESRVAVILIHVLESFLESHDLGIIAGESGMMRLTSGLVRIPDVSFVSWGRLPGRQVPRDPIPDLAPDVAVEVLSQGNTRREMKRKLQDYFAAGVKLVWIVDPQTRTAEEYTSPDDMARVDETGALDGRGILPGFSLKLGDLFSRADGHR